MKSKVLQSNVAAGEVSFNVVPLVDCIFLMIIFFILTSQMADPNITGTVFLPTPIDSQGKPAEDEKNKKNMLIINVVSDEGMDKKTGEAAMDPTKKGQAKNYAIGTTIFGIQDVAQLAAAFKEKKAEVTKNLKPGQEFSLVIRCDWRVRYPDVVPIFVAASDAGIAKMNITVEGGGPKKK